ncbi:hypothetical protein LXL04_021407 [Taraxacum kok-saghyz]
MLPHLIHVHLSIYIYRWSCNNIQKVGAKFDSEFQQQNLQVQKERPYLWSLEYGQTAEFGRHISTQRPKHGEPQEKPTETGST